MIAFSKESPSLPDNNPKIYLLSTPSTDQLSDKPPSASVSISPLHDKPQLTVPDVVHSRSKGDQTMPRVDSSGPTYAQPVPPACSEKVVIPHANTKIVVYDEVRKCQVSKIL